MKSMAVSEFKAKCIAVLKEVRESRTPVLVTLRGQPLAIVQPLARARRRKRLGALKGSMQIRGDIVRADTTADWETSE